jgi:hypothetical protein
MLRPLREGRGCGTCRNETVTRQLPVTATLPGMAPGTGLAPVNDIAAKIHTVRGVRVMLDAELAALYGVTTKRLNQQVLRNHDRFPADFAFQLTADEAQRLRLQSGDGLRVLVDETAVADDFGT